MKLTDKHKDIIAFIHQAPRTKSEIIERFKGWHSWGGASKYIPIRLAALVKHGFLECENDTYKLKFIEK